MNNKLGDFKKIINFEISKRGDFNNLNYNPTFKASAIFFFICNKYIDTKISFLNYWNIKNHKDIMELGLFDTSKDHIKIVEWPELIKLKPKNRIDISFHYLKLENSRKVKITGFGKWKDYKFNEI